MAKGKTKKEQFLELAESVTGRDVENVVAWLETTDFFEAPASMNRHGVHPEGLLEHSLGVLDMASMIVGGSVKAQTIPEESIIISCLFHDVCKVHRYVLDNDGPTGPQIDKLRGLCDKKGIDIPGKKFRTKGYFSKCIDALLNGKDMPEFSYSYRVKDQFPFGHGEKSVFLLQDLMALKPDEALAIRWHLGGFDPGTAFGWPSGFAQEQACRENPLVSLLIAADMAASYLMDEWS